MSLCVKSVCVLVCQEKRTYVFRARHERLEFGSASSSLLPRAILTKVLLLSKVRHFVSHLVCACLSLPLAWRVSKSKYESTQRRKRFFPSNVKVRGY